MKNIRYIDTFLDNFWDLSIFNDCFTDGIKMGDLDGIVERNGFFLVVEFKKPGVPLNTGQSIMFDTMVAGGKHTVLIVWGEKDKPERGRLMTSKKTIDYDVMTVDRMKSIVSKWFEYADSLQ